MSEEKLSIKDMLIALDVGKTIIDELEKKNPELTKPYVGKLKPYMIEYYNKFIKDDIQFMKKEYNETDSEEIMELSNELLLIECFCKWLDLEKGVKIIPSPSDE